MKIRINSVKKVVSFGDFVFVSNSDDSIIDTDETTVAELLEIASINELSVKAKRKADIINQIEAGLAEKNIIEVKEMTDTEKFLEIVTQGLADELPDAKIKENLYKAGADFMELNKIFSNIIAENELRLSPKQRKEKVGEFLEGYEPDVEDVASHLAKITSLEKFLDCATTQAGASMKVWAKLNDVELPKTPQKERKLRAAGYGGKHKVVADWSLENKDCTRDQLNEFAKANLPLSDNGKEAWKGYANDIWNAIAFAKQYSGVEAIDETDETDESEVGEVAEAA